MQLNSPEHEKRLTCRQVTNKILSTENRALKKNCTCCFQT